MIMIAMIMVEVPPGLFIAAVDCAQTNLQQQPLGRLILRENTLRAGLGSFPNSFCAPSGLKGGTYTSEPSGVSYGQYKR